MLRRLQVTREGSVTRPRARERPLEQALVIYSAARRTGNSPGTKWVAFNAVAEHLDDGHRYTTRTNQVRRSFEDTGLKQQALELVSAA